MLKICAVMAQPMMPSDRIADGPNIYWFFQTVAEMYVYACKRVTGVFVYFCASLRKFKSFEGKRKQDCK